jgi:hypothetical protein
MYTYTGSIHGAIPLLLISPCCSLLLPFLIPFTYLETLLSVTGSVHLGLRLLVNWPPLSSTLPIPSPLQIPRTQDNKRLTATTSRIWLLLSGTNIIILTGEDDTPGFDSQRYRRVCQHISRGVWTWRKWKVENTGLWPLRFIRSFYYAPLVIL